MSKDELPSSSSPPAPDSDRESSITEETDASERSRRLRPIAAAALSRRSRSMATGSVSVPWRSLSPCSHNQRSASLLSKDTSKSARSTDEATQYGKARKVVLTVPGGCCCRCCGSRSQKRFDQEAPMDLEEFIRVRRLPEDEAAQLRAHPVTMAGFDSYDDTLRSIRQQGRNGARTDGAARRRSRSRDWSDFLRSKTAEYIVIAGIALIVVGIVERCYKK